MRASLARREAAARLRDAGVASPERDADLLLAHVLDVPLGRLPLVDDLEAGEWERYDALLARTQDSSAASRAAMSVSTHESSTGCRSPSSTWSRL